MDDIQIVDLYLQRDETAIAQTAERYGHRLRQVSYRIVDDHQLAEECENDTYLQAWERIPPHEPKSYLYAFLARITRNLSIDCCRSGKRLYRRSVITELSTELENCIPAPDDVQCRMEAQLLADIISNFLKTQPEVNMNTEKTGTISIASGPSTALPPQRNTSSVRQGYLSGRIRCTRIWTT